MGALTTALLAFHIAAGSVAFLAAPVAMYARKGGPWHRRAGQAYLWGMAAALGAALPISILRPNPFLFAVALFSGYLVFSGYRALFRKRPDRGQGPAAADRWIAALAAATGAAMAAWALAGPLLGAGIETPAGGRGLAPVLLVFGLILSGFALKDLIAFARPFDAARGRHGWFFDHLTRMLAASIATYTAVAVVNLTALPPIARWLAPTVIGAAGIAWVTVKYRRRFARGAKPAEVATIKIGAE